MFGGTSIQPKVQEEIRRILSHVEILLCYGKYHYNVIKY